MNKIIKGANLSEDSFVGDSFKSNLDLHMDNNLFSDSVILEAPETSYLDAHGSDKLELPSTDFVTDAQIQQTGMDLHLVLPDGSSVVIVGYFAEAVQPELVSPSGASLTPSLVDSFKIPDPAMMKLAQTGDGVIDGGAGDPIGNLEIMSGEVFAVRTDGTRVQLQLGDPVYQGDQIETGADGSVKIKFVDETIFTLGEDARLALDELVFDPSATSGSSAFSILKGSFVFVSGQIAHDNYDNMEVTTPVATIGIRGTTVTGSVLIGDTAFTFSVLEGSIAISAGGETLTLSDAFATAVGNLSPSGRIEIAQSTANQDAVLRGNNKALSALGDNDLKKLETAIKEKIKEETGEDVELDIQGELEAIANEEPEPEQNEGDNEDGGDGAQGDLPPGETPPGESPTGDTGEGDIGGEVTLEVTEEKEEEKTEKKEELTKITSGTEDDGNSGNNTTDDDDDDRSGGGGGGGGGGDPTGPVTYVMGAGETNYTASSNEDHTVTGNTLGNTITTLNGADTLIISGGIDDLDGGAGSDTIDFVNKGTVSLTMSSATSGSYSLVDGSGTFSNIETVIGSGQIDNLTGNIGNDVFYGMDSNDYLYGLSGNDTLYGGNGNDNLVGGTGADTLQGDAGDDTINGGDGVDSIDGGAGTGDTITFSGATGGVNASFSATTGAGTITDDGFGNTETFSNIEILSGSSNDDTLSAAAATSGVTLVGNLGNDTITGGAGNDTLHDGGGNDTIYGGAGDDTIVSDSGADNYHGDAGTDTLDITGASNAVTLDTAAGTFTVLGSADVNNFIGFETYKGSAFADTLTGGTGNETLYGEAGNDTLTGGSGNDTLDGGAGDDTFTYEAGSDDYIGGLGADTLNMMVAGAGADINLTTGSITVSGETDTIAGIETINGSYHADTFVGDASDNIFSGLNGNETIDGGGGNDILTGGDNDDTINGGSGNDYLYGGAHADTLDGGTGNDTVNGEADDDNIYGSAGTDTIDGGTGTDTLQYINATSGVIITYGITDGSGRVITDGFGTVGSDTFSNIESIRGSSHNDILNGSANADIYYGSLGDDIIHGEAGADTLDGEDGNDIIFGGTGNDTIVGGIGDDVIDGGSGVDTLSGGAGTDILSYATATGGVTIDVAAGQATDDGYGNIDTISGFENYLGSNFDDIFYAATSVSAATESFDGGIGFDYLKYSNIASANVTITMSGQGFGTTNDDGYGTTDTFNGIDAFYGTQATGGDTFNGNIGDDIFSGLNGTDIINGGAGQDYLYGGGDNDTVNGGDGDDYLEGNAGADTINGDAGDDIINGGDGIDIIDGGTGTDTLKNDNAIAVVFTAAGAGTFSDDGYGNAESFVNIERIDGSAGGDTITGHDGNDYFIGNDGVDSLTGNNGDDKLFGGNGNDVINGGADNDFIQGGAGADSITLGTGTDTLYMHAASDSDSANTGDIIADFDFSADMIKFNTDIVTGDLTTGNFLDATSAGNFGQDDGKAKFFFDTGSKVAQFDLNGDGTEDMKITLTNATSFSVSNVGLHDVANVRDGLSFDGVNDYVALDDAAINNMTTGTISAWINLNKIGDGSAGSGAAISAAQLDFHSTNALFGVGLNDGANFTASAGQIVFNGKNTEAYALSNGTITADSWHHVAVTFSATSASIYIDGVLDNTVAGDFSIQSIPSTHTPPPGNTTYTLETSIGRMNRTGGSSADYELDGSIDDYAIWNTELTAAQISDYYNTGTSTADGNMRMHHTFDNQSAEDQLNNYDGTIAGAPTGITYDETYIEGHAGTQIYQDENIQLADSANLESAIFTITNFVAGDVLSATTFGSVIASYDHLNGVLRLTGYTNIADYEATIKSITFESPSAPFNTTTRTITGVISDGQYSENLNDVNLTMTANSGPVANADSFSVAAGGSVSNFDFLSNDTDANGDMLIVSNIIASDGTFIDNGDGTLNYTANNHAGTETISYTITDGVSETQGVITVTVT